MKEITQGKRKQVWLILLLFAACFVIYALWNCFGLSLISDGIISTLIDSVLIKALIWILPVMLFIKEEHKFKNMFRGRFPVLICIIFICATAAFLYTIRILNGFVNKYVIFDPMFVVLSLSAGVIEELAFRGGYFHLLVEQIGFWPAAVINGVMFTLMHYPGLIVGNFSGLISLRTLLIFSMGIAFCFMYHKWKNLALNMTVHTVWDILSYLFCLAG